MGDGMDNIKVSKNIFFILIISLFSFLITLTINKNYHEPALLLNNINSNSMIKLKFFWYSIEPSNLILYLFASQVALVVLTGTAVSFISNLLENKYYGFKVKEFLLYRFNDYEFNFSDYVICNFLLVFLTSILIVIENSELAIFIIFILTLLFTTIIIITIINIFFSTYYSKKKAKKIILNELDKRNKKYKLQDNFNIINDDYVHVEAILNRIKEHSFETIDEGDLKIYRDNIELIEEISYFLTIDFSKFYWIQKGVSPHHVEYIK